MVASAKVSRDVVSEFNVDERPLERDDFLVESVWPQAQFTSPRWREVDLRSKSGEGRRFTRDRNPSMPAALPTVTPTVSAWADAQFVDDGREGIPPTCCEL
jgi:hypothetical protein